MVWCANCTRHQPAQSPSSSLICCDGCGKVVNQEIRSKEPNFSKVAARKHEKEVSSLNPGKSLKLDMPKFKAMLRVCKHTKGGMSRKRRDCSECLSDIDDAEIESYLLKKDEMLYKKIIWERMNDEYSKAQAAKKAAAANAMRLKKEKQQRQAAEVKKVRGTMKLTDHTLTNKRTSSKVNYDALKEILGEPVALDKAEKTRTESYSEDDAMSKKSESGAHNVTDWGILDEDYNEGESARYQSGLYDDYLEEQFVDDNNNDFF